ncbi:hypothetical protein [Vibrio barjaei]|uniref:hypothetical protein n=1 Tax=Vibrio barjaei TaxID=1676683 RepID=UPI0022837DDD|nr:hypothetical protein [Vibrio barjaei]MCY9870377.1 hypothetical protein [Vibrio barjaei]
MKRNNKPVMSVWASNLKTVLDRDVRPKVTLYKAGRDAFRDVDNCLMLDTNSLEKVDDIYESNVILVGEKFITKDSLMFKLRLEGIEYNTRELEDEIITRVMTNCMTPEEKIKYLQDVLLDV